MPLFDYACQECGQQSELLVSNGSQPNCPKCGSERMNKMLPIVAAPSHKTSTGDVRPSGGGSCGAGCGCHPH